MNRNAIKELVKQVVAEEAEYQQLFKTMLDRSGKDINSMSDDDKKKFFNAVDKAYKAKSEGKLIDSKKKYKLNEDVITTLFGNAYVLTALGVFLTTFLKIAFVKGMRFLYRKGYQEAAENVWKKLINNQEFINHASNILIKRPNVDFNVALDIFYDSAIVIKLSKEELKDRQKKAKEKGDYDMLLWEELVNTLADGFEKAWNNKSIKNDVVNKLQNLLKK